MKRKYSNVSDKVKIIGIIRIKGGKKVIDCYLEHPKKGREYVFTRAYTRGTYNLLKGGISVKRLLQVRSKDKMVMILVKYTSLMMPYFVEEIDWMVA